jgi:hypothetical protein
MSKRIVANCHCAGGSSPTKPRRSNALFRYVCCKVQAMAEKYDDREIAAQLNSQAQTSSTGKAFTANMVRWIRFKHRISGPSLAPGTLTATQICERYGVSRWVVHYWIEHGIVSATQRKPNTPMPSQSMTPLTGGCESGWQTPDIFVHHPQRKLFEVHYARCVGMPIGRCEPSALGM